MKIKIPTMRYGYRLKHPTVGKLFNRDSLTFEVLNRTTAFHSPAPNIHPIINDILKPDLS